MRTKQKCSTGGKSLRWVYLPLVLLFAVVVSQASTITLTSTSGAGCTGNACSGTAVINIIDAHDFTVTLNNTLASITDAGQLLTDFEFKLPTGTVTETGSNGTFITINSNGTTTPAGSGSTGWGFGIDSGTGAWLLCIICGNGVSASGAQPAQGIVPNQATYSGNGSINGSPSHNPFLESGAVFTFTTTATLPTNGTNPFTNTFLSFGTTFGNEIPTTGGGGGGAGGPTPEPVSMMLSGAGLIGVALLSKRRKKSRA